jgi:hypothetical protein
MMRYGLILYLLTFISLFCSCSDVINTSRSNCDPSCEAGFRCSSSICQPILCSEANACPNELLCYEGRCIMTCDGQAPCQSGDCLDGLCQGEMDCQSGDVKTCDTACGEGVERCIDYTWSSCSSGQPALMDICEDGLDNDCDELIDEGCPDCELGSIQPCENECGQGEQSCSEGTWSACSVLPPDGTGLCPCMTGSFEFCETPCGMGQKTCNQGAFGACLYEGMTCECMPRTTESCETMCGTGQRNCEGGTWSTCQGPQPETEICNNYIDEDCDQQVDEGCTECLAVRLNANDFFVSLSSSYQSVPLATGGSSSWLAWYSGTAPRKAYAQSFQIEAGAIVKGERYQLPINSVNGLVRLGGGGYVHIGINAQETIHVTYLGATGISSSLSFSPGGTIWDSLIIGEALNHFVIYRSDYLYLKSIDRNASQQSSPPLRLSTKVNHLGHDAVWGGNRVAVIYQDDTGDFPEGRVLSMVQASADGRTIISESPINDPNTQGHIFVDGPPSIVFKSNQYLIVYSNRINGVSHIYSLVVTLDGDVVSGPNLIARSAAGLIAQSIDLSSTNQHRGLVWYETRTGEDQTQIKYMRLDPNGLPSSEIKVIAQGNLRIFPKIEWNLLGQVLISWTQTDHGGELGGALPTIRLGQYDSDPSCQ